MKNFIMALVSLILAIVMLGILTYCHATIKRATETSTIILNESNILVGDFWYDCTLDSSWCINGFRYNWDGNCIK
jgi:hypothetical protein